MYKFLKCPKCEGKGNVASKRQNGICFSCSGSKQIRVSESEYNAWKQKEEKKVQGKLVP